MSVFIQIYMPKFLYPYTPLKVVGGPDEAEVRELAAAQGTAACEVKANSIIITMHAREEGAVERPAFFPSTSATAPMWRDRTLLSSCICLIYRG